MINTPHSPEEGQENETAKLEAEIKSRPEFVEALGAHYHKEIYTPEKVAAFLASQICKNNKTLKIPLSDISLSQFLFLCCELYGRDFERDITPILKRNKIDQRTFFQQKYSDILG